MGLVWPFPGISGLKTAELSLELGGVLKDEPASVIVAHSKMSFLGCSKLCRGY